MTREDDIEPTPEDSEETSSHLEEEHSGNPAAPNTASGQRQECPGHMWIQGKCGWLSGCLGGQEGEEEERDRHSKLCRTS